MNRTCFPPRPRYQRDRAIFRLAKDQSDITEIRTLTLVDLKGINIQFVFTWF